MSTTVTETPAAVQQAVEGFRALADLISTGTLPIPQGATIYRHNVTEQDVRDFADKHHLDIKMWCEEQGRLHFMASLSVGKVGNHDIEFVLHAARDAK